MGIKELRRLVKKDRVSLIKLQEFNRSVELRIVEKDRARLNFKLPQQTAQPVVGSVVTPVFVFDAINDDNKER